MRLVMWVMVIYLSIAAVSVMSNSNGTTPLCDGSVEDCLNVHHLDSQLPTVSSSHLRRILDQTAKEVVPGTMNPSKASPGCRNVGQFYLNCGSSIKDSIQNHCAEAPQNRRCSDINPENSK
ncbi:unnamed protein product [Sphenostylis stenocarpa]|uniref:Uncharacterized protein n=1 Tax=Sphenostylis stenocarpa TaxID=92480 RepID=A0AA86RN42_9FABA|nr:unnamed protein product [Sphenostylis stenocarpa]